jgi:FKBP-type peptidyl-prolyl cis-trans isomerase
MKRLTLGFTFILLSIFSCQKDEVSSLPEEEQIENYISANNIVVTEKTSSGLRFVRTKESTGLAVKIGQTINLNYTGKLLSGKKFDSGNFNFVLGAGRVIKGFDEGVAKMKVGEKATLIFPSSIGYGYAGSGKDIPPYAPLLFEVEVVSAK